MVLAKPGSRRRKTVAVLFIGGRSRDAHDREIMARRGKERREGDARRGDPSDRWVLKGERIAAAP